MRSLQFIFTTLITFLFVTGAVFWRKAIAVFIFSVFSFNSGSFYSSLNAYAKADAAMPPSREIESLEHSGTTRKDRQAAIFTASSLDKSNVNKQLEPSCGQLTFEAEGEECPDKKSKCYKKGFHSREPHVPGDTSGVTIGRGYDLKERTPESIKQDLKNAGLNEQDAEAYSKAGCKKASKGSDCKPRFTGKTAKEFIENYKSELVEITLEQQLKLFEATYFKMEKDVERLSAKQDTEETYGKVDFCALNSKMKALLTDLRFRGDYKPEDREKIQKYVVDNNFSAFKDAIEDENYWINQRGVPQDRFDRRTKFLNNSSDASQCNRADNQCKCNNPADKGKSDNKQDNDACLVNAQSTNDPHLITFDGLKYDLQTVGEVVLIKSNHSAFEVQARQTPWNNSASVSINSAIAIKVGSDRVALYAQGLPDDDTTTPLRVNGKPTAIQGNKLALTGGGEILKQGGNYVISAPTGEKVLVSSNGSFLNLSPIVHNRSGKYSGLLGNVNGNPKDDLQVRDGKNVLEARSTYGDVKQVVNLVGLRLPGVLDRAEQVYFDQLYKEFANSWRVKQEESLFDYPAGKTTKSYLNPGFPDKYLTLNMLSADQIQKAQNACTEAKVSEELMEGCIFDVGFSGFTEFARTTAEISGYIGLVNQLIPGLNIPTPEQAVNVIIEKVKPKICAFGVCL